MSSTRWLSVLVLALAMAGIPTAAMARPASLSGAAGRCTTSDPQGVCGAYHYRGIFNSNGFDTYVANNCWADPSCQQTVTATNPGKWSVSADEPLGNRAVKTYPNAQQLLNNWDGSGWNGPRRPYTDTPVSALKLLISRYAESMPHNSVTGAQAAYDIWLGNNGSFGREVMVWVDNDNRRPATRLAIAVIFGRHWTLYGNRAGELIWSLDGAGGTGTFAQQRSGRVHLLALLRWLQRHGFAASGAVIGQVDFGWEICSTGGKPGTFTVSQYTLWSRCKTQGCR